MIKVFGDGIYVDETEDFEAGDDSEDAEIFDAALEEFKRFIKPVAPPAGPANEDDGRLSPQERQYELDKEQERIDRLRRHDDNRVERGHEEKEIWCAECGSNLVDNEGDLCDDCTAALEEDDEETG